jgi:hypothetical protein
MLSNMLIPSTIPAVDVTAAHHNEVSHCFVATANSHPLQPRAALAGSVKNEAYIFLSYEIPDPCCRMCALRMARCRSPPPYSHASTEPPPVVHPDDDRCAMDFQRIQRKSAAENGLRQHDARDGRCRRRPILAGPTGRMQSPTPLKLRRL